jgi:hypothetical protein
VRRDSLRIAKQPDGIAFCVLDTRIDTISNWQRCVRNDVPPERESDLRALGMTLGSTAPKPSTPSPRTTPRAR